MADKKSKDRASILIVGALFLATFVLINAQEFLIASFIYIVMGIMSLVLYSRWGSFGKLGNLKGIDNNFVTDALVGLGLGIGTIVLGSFVSFIGAIGIPPVQSIAGTVGRFIIIVPSASIFEEVFFRDLLSDFFKSKLKLGFLIANILTAIAFSMFHLVAYGESLALAGGSFLSAGIMGFIFGLVTEKQNSIIGSIFYHATLNFWIAFATLSVIIA